MQSFQMTALLKLRLLIGAAFVAGVTATVAYVALSSGRAPTSQSSPKTGPTSRPPQVTSREGPVRLYEAAPVTNAQAQLGSGNQVDPVQPATPPLAFRLDDSDERNGSGADRETRPTATLRPIVVNKSARLSDSQSAKPMLKRVSEPERIEANRVRASGLTRPLPLRRPMADSIPAKADEHSNSPLVASRRIRRIVVTTQADSLARKQQTPVRMQYAETSTSEVRREAQQPKQRSTSAQPDSVTQWLMRPSGN